MALKCLLGASQTWDAVAYVRAMIEDNVAPFTIPDATLALYVEVAAEEFSRWEPLGEHVVGSFGATPPSSPFNTSVGVSRYSCTPGNGFALPVLDIIDVLFKASGVFTANSEIAYLSLMPVSPLNWFKQDGSLLTQPSGRIIRDEMLQELAHYGSGYWSPARDSSGVKAIDIYPVPTSVTPLFVRYTSSYIGVIDGQQNTNYPTIPENLKRYFGKFILIETLEQEADRLARSSQLKAGVMQRWSSPGAVRSYVENLKSEVQLAMGAAVTIGKASW